MLYRWVATCNNENTDQRNSNVFDAVSSIQRLHVSSKEKSIDKTDQRQIDSYWFLMKGRIRLLIPKQNLLKWALGVVDAGIFERLCLQSETLETKLFIKEREIAFFLFSKKTPVGSNEMPQGFAKTFNRQFVIKVWFFFEIGKKQHVFEVDFEIDRTERESFLLLIALFVRANKRSLWRPNQGVCVWCDFLTEELFSVFQSKLYLTFLWFKTTIWVHQRTSRLSRPKRRVKPIKDAATVIILGEFYMLFFSTNHV